MYEQQGHIPKALSIFKFQYINNKVICFLYIPK